MLTVAPTVETPLVLQKAIVEHGYAQKPGNGISLPIVLTYPVHDREGDFVEPEGGEWVKDPIVNWNHQIPIGRAAGPIEYRSIPVDGQMYNLPIGQTKFFKSAAELHGLHMPLDLRGYSVKDVLSAAAQAESLIGDGITNGVSLEFQSRDMVPIGPSLMRGANGKAYHHKAWTGLGWAHAPIPINPMAQVVMEKAIKAIEGGRLLPVIHKSLELAIPRRKTVVQGNYEGQQMFRKANTSADLGEPPDDLDVEGVSPGDGTGLDDDAGVEGGAEGSQPVGVAKALYEANQAIHDVLDGLSSALDATDNPKAKRDVKKIVEKLRGVIDVMPDYADKLHAELSGAETPEPDPDAEPEPVERDDDGSIITKAFPFYKVARIKLSDLQPPVIRKAKKQDGANGDDVVLKRGDYEELIALAKQAQDSL